MYPRYERVILHRTIVLLLIHLRKSLHYRILLYPTPFARYTQHNHTHTHMAVKWNMYSIYTETRTYDTV